MKRSTRLIITLPVSLALVALAIACGGEQENAPVAAAAPGGTESAASVQEISAEARQCIELVRAENYTAAVETCKRALDDAANAGSAEVQEAYAQAKAAVQSEAQAAGLKAASDAAAGKPAN